MSVTSVVSNSLQPMGCSSPGSSAHGIFQARILQWFAIPSSGGSSWPRDQTQVSALQADSLLSKPPWKPNHQQKSTERIWTRCHCLHHQKGTCLQSEKWNGKAGQIFNVLLFWSRKESAYNTRDRGSIPGEGNGNPLQYSCLENPMDRGASQPIAHGVARSRTQLNS